MKKTLAAIAVLGAFAGSAMAADVTLYGIVDMGLGYSHTKTFNATTGKYVKDDSYALKSGQNSPSRFGLKGEEDLGNGLKVGFLLENTFTADDGQLDASGRFFHRESILYVNGAFGEVAFGRTGAIDGTTGRYALMGSAATALGGGWDGMGNSGKIFLGAGSRMDNTIAYRSPTFAGFTFEAQASLKKENVDKDGVPVKTEEGSSDADRYYGLGVKYAAGALGAGFTATTSDYKRSTVNANAKNDDNSQVYTAYVNYDFGFVKPMLAAQYYDLGTVGAKKGYGVILGATAPVLGGKLKATVGYNDSDEIEGQKDYNVLMFGVGYEYPLSKRTFVYAGAGYSQDKTKAPGADTIKNETTQVMAGICHSF